VGGRFAVSGGYLVGVTDGNVNVADDQGKGFRVGAVTE